MRIRWHKWASFLIVGLMMRSVFAQDAAPPSSPAADARAVRVRIGHTGGMCGGFGYCTDSTTVEPSFIVSELKNVPDKRKFPDRRTKRAITKKDWEDLQRSIDAKALKALPQPAGCRPCIDLPDSWVAVQYSDGSTISVSYDPMNPPAPIAALLRKIPSIQAKLKP